MPPICITNQEMYFDAQRGLETYFLVVRYMWGLFAFAFWVLTKYCNEQYKQDVLTVCS